MKPDPIDYRSDPDRDAPYTNWVEFWKTVALVNIGAAAFIGVVLLLRSVF